MQSGHAFSELAKKTAAVASDTLIISDFVTSLSLAQPVETLKACRVDPETITTAMSIQPASASFSGTRDETRPFLVQGGAFPYMMSVRGTDSNLVSVDQPAGFGPSFTITVKSGAPAGLYAIHVADGSRRTASLPLEVVGAKPGDDGGDGPGTRPGEAFGKLILEQRKQVQRALCVDDDGDWGPDTRAALDTHAGSGDSTDENLRAQLELTPEAVAARCSAGGKSGGPEQSLRETLDKASKAVKGQSIDLEDPAGFAVTVTESTVTGDGLALSVTISIQRPGGGSQVVKVSAIRTAILTKLIQDSTVTLDHVRIANLDALISDGLVSNE